jgi:thimet oligopeptidase
LLQHIFILSIVSGIVAMYFLFFNTPTSCKGPFSMNLNVQTPGDVQALFPTTPQEIMKNAQCFMQQAQQELTAIINLKTEDRTFANTAYALDQIIAFSDFAAFSHIVEVVEFVYPDPAMRDEAHNASIAMREFFVDAIGNNQELYRAFNAYAYGSALTEDLRPDQRYFIQETLSDFKRAGLDLPTQELSCIKTLKKELSALCADFEKNIATDNRTIGVQREELEGLDNDFIDQLKRTEDGKYILGTDYPTYFQVMDNCRVAQTRKKLFDLFINRGYPANDAILKQLIAKRDELARRLGFISFAHLDIDAQMAKTPERVQNFLQGLAKKTAIKANKEITLFKEHLPASVALTAEGKFNPWDMAYTKNQFKKSHLQVDELAIAEYFPMESTIQGLLAIYEKFLGVHFEQLSIPGFWHTDVQLIATYNKTDHALLGYLLLDLHPRENKFSHAAHAGILPATKKVDGALYPEVSLVMANFPRSTATKPSLLKLNDVSTFFHEFGHAMHGLLGRTYLASQAGTSVKTDFVEMPSQMLEEWLWDRAILKQLSKHYITGESLSNEMITNILKLKHFDSGDSTQRQVYLALFSLALFASGADKDPYTIQGDLYTRLRPHVQRYADDHMYASFGHLPDYAAKYYGYLWSKVFALDMFAMIKQEGLLNPQAGARYRDLVIGQGGSKDPNEILYDFLGREPNDKAFFTDLGV